ncbi:MAG: acetyltransferase [Chitinophagales bacterium]|nr:acetyltransferase [Chitinophagales bacterium]
MILFGASGHGKVIADILELNGIDDITIWDDNATAPVWDYETYKPDAASLADEPIIISIGSNEARKKVVERLPSDANYIVAIHPQAVLARTVSIDNGTVIMGGVVINPDTTIGKHCIINTNASVDHDCKIGDYVHISPNVALCGNISIGEGTHIGAGTVVIPGKKIGKWCVIGAGSVIIEDVPDYATVVGNPGRVIKTSKKD